MPKKVAERITKDPAVMVGKPVVKGTRIPVELVLRYLADTPNFEELMADYPELTLADVQACLRYASERVSPGRKVAMPPSSRRAAGEVPG
jgi:uncharacterized protein (DUF433 family)